MSIQRQMLSAPPAFLSQYLEGIHSNGTARPHITVTWAQSLDAKIAGPGGARVLLSGPESMEMTHWLRTMHDAILIGIDTLILDNPRLKIQLVPQNDTTLLPPQPLILDSRLRFPVSSRILHEWTSSLSQAGNANGPKMVRQPWIICGDNVERSRREEVEAAGARVIRVALDSRGHIPPTSLPNILNGLGLRSVMIEGGSRILSAFLRAGRRNDETPLVDKVVVTVAPMFIGEGIGFVPEADQINLPELKSLHTETMGKDSVMVCAMIPRL